MSERDFKTIYLSADERGKLRLLARFAFDLTIEARATYAPQGELITDDRRIRAINELQHRVLSRLSSLADGEMHDRADEEQFADLLITAAAECRCTYAINESVQWHRGNSPGVSAAGKKAG
ncbi:MAG: hypothetical protein QOF78_3389 [Phycisphaerales bacterium]|jgi:hypothetical protein|nr:hypothetical protein [Phycisphaerales bacterium]